MSGKGAGFWLSVAGLAISFIGSIITSQANKQTMTATIEKEVAKALPSALEHELTKNLANFYVEQ